MSKWLKSLVPWRGKYFLTAVALFATALIVAGLQIDPAAAQTSATGIYWTDFGTDKVQRSPLDGTVEDVIATGLNTPNGIAVDSINNKVYWVDAGPGTVERSDLDGSNAEVLVSGLNFPVGLALDVAGGKVYWTDAGAEKIQRANLDGTSVEDVIVTGGAANVTNASGIAVDATNGKLYWTDLDADTVQRANLDGTIVEDLITTGLTQPRDIALDVAGGKMYVVDTDNARILQADLAGTNQVGIVTTGINVPRGIALDLAASKIYWTDSGADVIQRADLDGTNVEEVVGAAAGLTSSTFIDVGPIPDQIPPEITVLGDDPVTVEAGTTYTDAGATATDNVDPAPDLTDDAATAVDTSTLGQYTVTYTATDDAGNQATATRTVNVEDTTPPTITVTGDNPVTVEAGTTYTDAGATATDTIDPTPDLTDDAATAVDTNTVGQYTVTYTATDDEGNQATATRTVNVEDTTPPTITILGDNPVSVELGSTYTDAGATATDTVDPAPELTDDAATAVDTSTAGQYTVTYTATDDAGNTATATRTVNVGDSAGPTILSTSPTNSAVDVPVDANVVLEFSENIRPRATGVTFVCQPGDVPVRVALSRSGNTFTLNPRNDFPTDATCTLSLPVTSITDDSGNNLVDNDGSDDGFYRLVFSTVRTPPFITDTVPDDGASDVNPATNISVTLSEAVQFRASGVTFECPIGGRVLGALSRSGNTYTLNPRNDLPAGAVCLLSIPLGNVTDDQGNNLVDDDSNPNDGTYTVSFSVDEPPRVVDTTPDAGATDVAVDTNISITLSESARVIARGVSFRCSPGGGFGGAVSRSGNTYTLDPNNNLPTDAICTLAIPTGNVTDTTGNNLVDDDSSPTDDTYTLSFTTVSGATATGADVQAAEVEDPEAPEIEMGVIEEGSDAIELPEIEIGD